MTSSKPDLSDREGLTRLARIVASVRACTTAEFLIVGAAARDLVLHHQHGIPLQRATFDVDLAVAITDWVAFDDPKTALTARSGFVADARNAHRLHHPELGDVDLVPFGAVEEPDGSLQWPPTGDPVMNVLGFREALETSQFYVLPDGIEARVVSPALMAVLKLIAWADRGRRVPRKDANDLFFLLRHYEEAGNSLRIYDDAAEVLGRFDYATLGAWLLGRDAQRAIRSCAETRPDLQTLVRSIVDRECEAGGALRLVGDADGDTAQRRLDLLCAFRDGFALET